MSQFHSLKLTHDIEIPKLGPMLSSTVFKMYSKTEEAMTPNAMIATSQMLAKISEAAVNVVVAMALLCNRVIEKQEDEKHGGEHLDDTIQDVKGTSFARAKESVRSRGLKQECELVPGANASGYPKGMRLKSEMIAGENAFTPITPSLRISQFTSESMSHSISHFSDLDCTSSTFPRPTSFQFVDKAVPLLSVKLFIIALRVSGSAPA